MREWIRLSLIVLVALLWSYGVGRAAYSPTPVFLQSIIAAMGQSTNGTPGTSGSPITVVDCTANNATQGYNCSTNGAKINSLSVVSTDTVARNVTCAILNNAVNYILFVKQIPIASASASTSFNGFATSTIQGLPIDEGTNAFIYLTTADKLVCWANAVSASQTITYTALGGAF